ncbi:MAG: hypothetical protein F4168_11280 [Gemmatimonadetes bacterium]|nr:hypothetical protein [Gemmatimonadota bacterium]
MRLAPPPLEITETEAFDNSDTFKARSAGTRLTSIVTNLEGHGAIVLDGPWGSGKSTFAKQWAGDLRSEGHPVVWVDAFETDHHDDAFIPMMLPIVSILEERRKEDRTVSNILTQLTNAAKNIAPVLAAAAVDAGLLVTSNLSLVGKLGWLTLKAGPNVRKLAREREETAFDKRLGQARATAASLGEFQEKLAQAVDVLSTPADRSKPLVFMIDELDRCKPDFALQVLERMKHVFGVDGICFVLVTHLDELAAMVRRAYGLKDPQHYLDKFYHLRLNIERLLSSGGLNARVEYVTHLVDSMRVPLPEANVYVLPTINNLIDVHEVPLRSVERIILNLGLYNEARRCSEITQLGHLAAALCVVRSVSPDLYGRAMAGELTFAEMQGFLMTDRWHWGMGSGIRAAVEGWWWLVTSDDAEDEDSHRLKKEIEAAKAAFDGALRGDVVFGNVKPRAVLREICADVDLFWQE